MHLTPDRNAAAARARKSQPLSSRIILLIVFGVVVFFGFQIGLEFGHWLRRVAALMHSPEVLP